MCKNKMCKNDEVKVLNAEAITPPYINETNIIHCLTSDKIDVITKKVKRSLLDGFRGEMSGGGTLRIDEEDIKKVVYSLIKTNNTRIRRELKRRDYTTA